MDQTLTNVALWYVVLVAASLFLASLIVAILLLKIVRLLTRNNQVFGTTPRVRLISLGLAAIVSPTTIPIFVSAFVQFLLTLFVDTSGALYANWSHVLKTCTENQSSCISSTAFDFLAAWSAGLSNAYSKLPALPIASLITVLMLWAAFAFVLTQARIVHAASDREEITRGAIWLRWLRTNLNSVAGYNLAFFVLLMIGGYLSIAAIAAIPGLQEKAPASAELSADKLKQQLDASLNQLNGFADTLPVSNPFDRLEKYLKDREASPKVEEAVAGVNSSTSASPKRSTSSRAATTGAKSEPSPPATPSPSPVITAAIIKNISDDVATQSSLRQQLLSSWKSSLDSTKSQLQSKKDQAVNIYTSENADGRGSKERSTHFISIDDWYRYWTTAAHTQLNDCSQQISQINQFWAIWADDTYRDLTANKAPEAASSINNILTVYYPRVQEACRAIQIDERAPDRPKLGSDLGAFTFVARWLLQTESLPLALITGLLGFGLLGSACSTFVREHAVRKPGEPIVTDLQGVVIRGLSAAIVIFLAVEGGLAVFSGNSAEPNPYVLLFTCLVAAVFSEDVWNWAHEKLLDSFGSEDEDGEDDDTEESSDSEGDDAESNEDEAMGNSEDEQPLEPDATSLIDVGGEDLDQSEDAPYKADDEKSDKDNQTDDQEEENNSQEN